MTRRRKIVDLATVRKAVDGLRELRRQHPELATPKAQARLGAYLDDLVERDRIAGAHVTVSLLPEELDVLDDLAGRVPTTRTAMARAALRIGAGLLAGDGSPEFTAKAWAALPPSATDPPRRRRRGGKGGNAP